MTDPSNLNDDDITSTPTERDDDLDLGGEGERAPATPGGKPARGVLRKRAFTAATVSSAFCR